VLFQEAEAIKFMARIGGEKFSWPQRVKPCEIIAEIWI